MPSHSLLLGHVRLRQFGSSPPPARIVDCDQSRPALNCITAGGWSCCYARTRDGDVYSLQAAVYRVVPLHFPGSGPHQAVAVDLPAASKVDLPDREQCIGWVRIEQTNAAVRVHCATRLMCVFWFLFARLSVGWDGLVAVLTDRGSLVSWQDGEEAPPAVLRPSDSVGRGSKCSSRFVAVAVATGMTVMAVAEDGSLWSWRPRSRADPAATDLEPVAWPCARGAAHPPRVAEVCCGRRHVALRDHNGKAWTYGWGLYGQLGHGHSKDCEAPTLVTATEDRAGRGRCKGVACGGWHTAFLVCTDADGTDSDASSTTFATRLLTCGWNEGGQLGHMPSAEEARPSLQPAQQSSAPLQNQGQTTGSICSVPTAVPALDGIPMSAIACGSRYTLVATVAGELFAFGWSVRGELAANNRTMSSALPADSTPPASKRKRQDTSQAQHDDHDDAQQYWHEPVCLTTDHEGGSAFSSAVATVVVDAQSLSSGGWHASVGCDFERSTHTAH